ncbi:hypothetical protein ACFYU8_17775 [Brevibacillus sp. NPDC003359]|uniref:hypothetical protein n=1 Tax=unclassified Brevibacillus TaxID=2684853 RepID=UPI0036ACACD8
MIEWLEDIRYGSPLQLFVEKAAGDQFVTYIFDWNVSDVKTNGIPTRVWVNGNGVLAARLVDFAERETLFRMIKREMNEDFLQLYACDRNGEDIESLTLDLIRPVIFSYDGPLDRIHGYHQGEDFSGIVQIPEPVPVTNLTISDRCSDVVIDEIVWEGVAIA